MENGTKYGAYKLEYELNKEEILQFKNGTYEEFRKIILGLFLEKIQETKTEVNWPFSIILYVYEDRIKINPLTMEYEQIKELNQKEIDHIYKHFEPNVSSYGEITKNIAIHYFIENFEKPSNHDLIDLAYKIKNFKKNYPNI